MAGERQVQLRAGNRILALNDASYRLQADKGWVDDGERLTVRVLVRPATLHGLSGMIAPIEQMCQRAAWHEERLAGVPVWVYQKSCDDLSQTAEIGATWLRKRVLQGTVRVEAITGTAAQPAAILALQLTVEALWQRAAAAPVLRCAAGAVNVDSREDQGLTTYGAVELWAPRLGWSAATGLTVRVFWTYGGSGSNQLHLARLGTMRAYWGHSASRWYILDEGGHGADTGVLSPTVGRTYEIVARWASGSMAIFIDGVKKGEYSGAVTWPTAPESYRVLETDASTGTQHWRSVQVWGAALSDTQIAGLAAWGMPQPELSYVVPPANGKATAAAYQLYNVPGEDAAPLRLLLASSGGQNFARVLGGVHPLRLPTTLYECEAGTLGSGTASNSDAAASGGSQARWTPADTAWGTRVTRTLAANPVNVDILVGDYRLYLAGVDNAATVQVNALRWRLVVAGQAGDWCEARSFGAVGQRALVDLGELTIPPMRWPEESLTATTTAYGSAYITLEIQTRNGIGSGGGTVDMDAIYLAPLAQIGQADGTFTVATQTMLLDWATAAPLALLVGDRRSLEFAAWAAWVGDDLRAPATPGVSGLLWMYWIRAAGVAAPNDTCDVTVLCWPRWRH